MYESNGWDYGPGNIDDFGPSADQYTVPTEADYNSYYDLASGPNPNSNVYDFQMPESTFNVPSDQGWGDQSFAPGSAMSNIIGASSPNMSVPQTSNFLPEAHGMDGSWNFGGLQNTLSSLFNSKGFESGMRGLAALLEGSQNKKKSSQLQQIVNNNRTMIDPFGSQRPFYQQQLQSAVTDPYSAPIVKNQVDQIALAQARKDAAAGRRSNSATSDPAMLAAQAKVAQDYINSLYTPAGAGINPNSSAALSLLEKGTNADVNGYISPLMSALGYGTQQNSNTAALDAIKQALAKQGG
jgi:hypothetical protein